MGGCAFAYVCVRLCVCVCVHAWRCHSSVWMRGQLTDVGWPQSLSLMVVTYPTFSPPSIRDTTAGRELRRTRWAGDAKMEEAGVTDSAAVCLSTSG